MKQKKSKAKRPAPRKKPPERVAKPPPPTKKPVAVKPKTVRKPEDPRVKKFQSALGHALYNRRMLDRAFAELREKMSDTKKKALQALAAAALAVSAAAQVLAEDEETSTPAEPAKPETPKAPASKKKTEAPKPAETPAAEPKAEEKAKPAADDGKAIMDKIRDACKEYANVYGRDGLRAVLDKYAPGKTVADIPADKLPEFLKDLGG
jgi:hypothetical protein